MSDPSKDLPEQSPPAGSEPASDQTPPPGDGQSPGEPPPLDPDPSSDGDRSSDHVHTDAAGQIGKPATTPMMDEQLKSMLKDNNERLWYITRFGSGKFPDSELATLVEVRRSFRENPNYQLTCEEEVLYRKATMLASEFLEDRRPEAIRLYADVQEEKKTNPLRRWLWWIGIVLILALMSNGYQSLIGIQIQRMKVQRQLYLEEASKLSKLGTDLPASLARMCEQRLVYKAAALQLQILLPSFGAQDDADGPGDTKTGDSASENELPAVCTVIKDVVITPPTEAFGASGNGTDTGLYNKLLPKAQKAAFAPSKQRPVRLRAELYDNVLALVVMPMLYALLGALTSAVRTANDRFKSMTLTQIDSINLGARILLGLVGGATIGIVFSTETLEGSTGLTVIGLAFAVGYAVDLFFNLLDGIKIGLGSSSQSKSQMR